MNLQGFYTTKGLALAAKLAAGTALVITKVTAGAGETAVGASALAAEKQTLTVGSAQTTAQTAALPVTLAETKASASYSLTELGVYARDPDVGEILYQVFRLDEARAIAAGGGSVYRFYLKETVGAAGVTVSCSPSGLLIDEDLAPTRSKVLAAAAGSVSRQEWWSVTTISIPTDRAYSASATAVTPVSTVIIRSILPFMRSITGRLSP